MLNQISKELIGEKEVQVGVTIQSIDAAIERLQIQIKQQQNIRNETLRELLNEAIKVDGNKQTSNQFDDLGERWANLQSQREKSLVSLNAVKNRIQELQKYKEAVDNELLKVNRAKAAGKIFADLKITHCPACDQSIESPDSATNICFLCKRPIEYDHSESDEGSFKRIDFEIEHLKMESQEANELISEILDEQKEVLNRHRLIEEDIQLAESQLYSIRRASASILPPEIAILDMDTGRIQERVRQLERMKSALDLRQALSQQIDEIQKEVTELENQVNELSQKIDFEKASDKLTDGMNTYLNSLVAHDKQLWTQGRINWKLREKGFNVTIADSKWSAKLGGTLSLYFLFAYHYALFSLTNEANCHYPGLLILDLPAKLEDGSTVKDQENFILEPFARLVKSKGMQNTQVIVTGDSFEQLENAHRIELDRVWK